MRPLLVLAAVLLVIGCGRPATPDRFNGPTMGTTYAIDDVLAETGGRLSTHDAAGEISRFNATASVSRGLA